MSRKDVLVDAQWALANLDDPKVVFIEVDEDTAVYETNHIRNAIRLDWKKELQDPVRRDFINKEGFEKLLSSKGVKMAKARARAAGRPWPNLVDNVAAARAGKTKGK